MSTPPLSPTALWEQSLQNLEEKSKLLSYANVQSIKDKVDWEDKLFAIRRKSVTQSENLRSFHSFNNTPTNTPNDPLLQTQVLRTNTQ